MSELILHIGMGKCGSSAIQNFLSQNKRVLLSNGVIGYGPNIPDIFNSGFATKLKELKTLLEFLRKDSERKNIYKVIFSSEALSNIREIKTLEQFGRTACNQFKRVTILVYLRRQDNWIQSAYKQWGIRHKTYKGPVKDFDSFFRIWRHQLDYLSMLNRWKSAFQRSRIIVQPFEKAQLLPGLSEQFANLTDISSIPKLRFIKKKINENFGHNALALLKDYNSSIDDQCFHPELVKFLRDGLGEKAIRGSKEPINIIPYEKRFSIYTDYFRDNEKIAKTYLGRPDGKLFYEPPPSKNDQWDGSFQLELQHFSPLVLELLFSIHKRLERIEQERKSK